MPSRRAGDALSCPALPRSSELWPTIGLMLLAPISGRVDTCSAAEYFALYLLAFCTLGGLASKNQAKAALAAAIGLGIAMIGLDNQTGIPRLTFGEIHLMDGVDFLVAIVGLFAVSEIFMFIESHGRNTAIGVKLDRITIPFRDIINSFPAMLAFHRDRFHGLDFSPGAGASWEASRPTWGKIGWRGTKDTFRDGKPEGCCRN